MDQTALELIVGQYQRNGWELRRVLATPSSGGKLDGIPDLTVRVNSRAEIDALWFSRARTDGRVAWEIRHLSDVPYALVEVLEPSIGDDELEQALAAAELRMKQALQRRSG